MDPKQNYFTETQYFLKKSSENTFLWPNLIFFMPLEKIQWIQSFAFSELFSNKPKSEIHKKIPMFEQLKKSSSSELKKMFDPSIDT